MRLGLAFALAAFALAFAFAAVWPFAVVVGAEAVAADLVRLTLVVDGTGDEG